MSNVSKLSFLISHKKPGLVFGSLIWELTPRNSYGGSVCEREKEGSPSVVPAKLTTPGRRSHSCTPVVGAKSVWLLLLLSLTGLSLCKYDSPYVLSEMPENSREARSCRTSEGDRESPHLVAGAKVDQTV